MAHGREEFALVGYSEDLERKPLKFVDPIPSSRICSACCNVPRLMLMLVCGNNFCESCYNSCSTISECVCPMDGDSCAIADISSKEYPAEQLLRRTVHDAELNEFMDFDEGCCGVQAPSGLLASRGGHGCNTDALFTGHGSC
ncbi:uncharacterized protein LOC144145679 isoform X2 [Haemaphysalis longicornis]